MALTSCGLRPDSRAQDLSLEDFVGVHCALGEQVWLAPYPCLTSRIKRSCWQPIAPFLPLASQTPTPPHLQVLRELLPEGHEGALDQDYDTE